MYMRTDPNQFFMTTRLHDTLHVGEVMVKIIPLEILSLSFIFYKDLLSWNIYEPWHNFHQGWNNILNEFKIS